MRAVAGALVVVFTALLGGCGPGLEGGIALGRSSSGDLQIVIQTCDHDLEGAMLLKSGSPDALVEWSVDRPGKVSTSFVIRLDGTGLPAGVNQDGAFDSFEPQSSYILDAFTTDVNWNIESAGDFTLQDVNEIKMGEVLFPDYQHSDGDIVQMDIETFKKNVC